MLFDGTTKTTVNIDVLKRKNVYLLISTLDITDEEISVLKPVHDTPTVGYTLLDTQITLMDTPTLLNVATTALVDGNPTGFSMVENR